MIKPLILFLPALFLPFANGYADPPKELPPELVYQGKPLDSLCFLNMEGSANIINLQQCGVAAQKYVVKGNDPQLIQQGFIGYRWQDPEISSEIQGYSYYQFLNAGNKSFWIYAINNGGASGVFTTIYLITRTGDHTIATKSIVDGDRCNHGVAGVSEKNTVLTYAINLTPYSFIMLADPKIPGITAYDDLADCAACCIGKAVYTITATGLPQFHFMSADNIINYSNLSNQGTYQACFNEKFTVYLKNNNNSLTQDKINAFAKDFKETCLTAENAAKKDQPRSERPLKEEHPKDLPSIEQEPMDEPLIK